MLCILSKDPALLNLYIVWNQVLFRKKHNIPKMVGRLSNLWNFLILASLSADQIRDLIWRHYRERNRWLSIDHLSNISMIMAHHASCKKKSRITSTWLMKTMPLFKELFNKKRTVPFNRNFRASLKNKPEERWLIRSTTFLFSATT